MRSKSISLVKTIALVFSLVSVLLSLFFVVVFYFSYYHFADQELRNVLTQTADQLNQNYFVYVDNQIKYLQDENMVSITDLLKSKDLSAVIFDVNGNRVGTFGIYRLIYDSNGEAVRQINAITENVAKTDSTLFTHIDVLDSTYETYTTILKYENRVIGYLQIAKQYSLIQKMRSLNYTLLLLVLPPALLIIWFSIQYVFNKLMYPFKSLAEIFSVLSVDKFPKQLSTNSNFTEIQTLVRASNSMVLRLKEGIEGQRHFAAYASHEINTPLTRAISSLEVINLKNDIDLEPNIDELYRVSELLSGLLLLLQPSSTRVDYSCDLVESLNIVLSQLNVSSKVNLIKEIPEELTVNIHPAHAYMLFNNIIKNAIKYTPEGTIKVLLQSLNEKGFIFEVTDTGVGVAQTDLSQIFEPFFRTESTKLYPGIGIGLSLVKQLCNFYNFKLSFESKEHIGTKVRVIYQG